MDILSNLFSSSSTPSPLIPVTVLASGPVPGPGPLSIVLAPTYPHPKLFVSDLGKRGLHMEHGVTYDLGSLYTQKQIYDSYELKTWLSTGVIIGVIAGTTPSLELTDATVTINPGDIQIGAVELKDGVADIRVTVKSDGVNNAVVTIQNAPTPGVALESKQDTANALLTSISIEDFATELTLSGIKSQTDLLTFTGTRLQVETGSAPASTATLSNITGSITNVTIAAANALRKGLTIYNDATNPNAALYLKFGATASISSFTIRLPASSFYEMPTPIYTGILDGIWSTSASSTARVTELT